MYQEYPETCREPAFLSLLPIMPQTGAGIPKNSLRLGLSFPALLLSTHKGKEQHCSAFRSCCGIWAPLSGCCWREARGESCMSQLRSESCACRGLPKGLLRGKCFPSGTGLDWIPGHWKKYSKMDCLSWDERVRGMHTLQKCLQCAWKHKLSSYYRMYKTEIFSSMRAVPSH